MNNAVMCQLDVSVGEENISKSHQPNPDCRTDYFPYVHYKWSCYDPIVQRPKISKINVNCLVKVFLSLRVTVDEDCISM